MRSRRGMSRIGLIVAMGILGAFFISGGEGRDALQAAGSGDRLLPLMLEVNALSGINLARGLLLTPDQIRNLQQLAGDSRAEWQSFNRTVEREYAEARAALGDLKRILACGEKPPAPQVRRAEAIMKRLRERHAAFENRMRELTTEAHHLLTPNQIVMVAEFSPCLVPPDEKLHPERVGQVADTGPAEKLLSRVRRYSEATYRSSEPELAARISDLRKKHGLPCADSGVETERIAGVLRKARALSDEEFSLKAPLLAKELVAAPEHMPAEGRQILERIRSYLLNPDMVDVYRLMAADR